MRAEDTSRQSGPSQQAPLRRCPTCGLEARTHFERCPSCSANYFAPPRAVVRRRRRAIGAVLGALAVAGAVLAVLLAGQRSENERRMRAEQAAAARELEGRLRRIQAPHRGGARGLVPARGATAAQRLAARAALVSAVEQAITRDARGRVTTGELDGPIAETICGPLRNARGGVPDDRDLREAIGRYDCVAVKRPIIDGSGRRVASLGHAFVAALDFRRFTYTWCRNTPPPGEAGKALVTVRLDRACLAAKGPPLGTGYVDVPDR